MNSGTIDSLHGDMPELANRIRTWIGVGNEVVVLSDQPHRVAELLTEQELPRQAARAGVGVQAAGEQRERRCGALDSRRMNR